MDVSQKIIIALDTDADQALALAQKLEGTAQWLKVGMTLYYSAGPSIVEALKARDFKVFVDLKLHDIPHQVRGAAKAVAAAGADMLTVHASGGSAMMQAACEGAEEGAALCGNKPASQRPLCLAITVLTSLDNEVLDSIGVTADAAEQVLLLADLAEHAGMDGIVCSPQETAQVRKQAGADFALVTPGIRPAGSNKGDQARVATPASALAAGADYLVIGRPITEASDPVAAFEAIRREVQ